MNFLMVKCTLPKKEPKTKWPYESQPSQGFECWNFYRVLNGSVSNDSTKLVCLIKKYKFSAIEIISILSFILYRHFLLKKLLPLPGILNWVQLLTILSAVSLFLRLHRIKLDGFVSLDELFASEICKFVSFSTKINRPHKNGQFF